MLKKTPCGGFSTPSLGFLRLWFACLGTGTSILFGLSAAAYLWGITDYSDEYRLNGRPGLDVYNQEFNISTRIFTRKVGSHAILEQGFQLVMGSIGKFFIDNSRDNMD